VVAAYRSQPIATTQLSGVSVQKFAAGDIQLAHGVLVRLQQDLRTSSRARQPTHSSIVMERGVKGHLLMGGEGFLN
jgi:hypothetical protein